MTSTLPRALMAVFAALVVVGAGFFAQGVDVAAGPPSSGSPGMVGQPPPSPPTTAEEPEPVVSIPTVEPGSGGSDDGPSSEGTDCPPGVRSVVGVACDSGVSDPG